MIRRITLVFSIFILLSFLHSDSVEHETEFEKIRKLFAEERAHINLILQTNSTIMLDMQEKINTIEVRRFKDKLATLESRHNWKIVNRFGYVGKYQFGYAARKAVGAPYFTANQFRKNPHIWPEEQQDAAVEKLMYLNYKHLQVYYNKKEQSLNEYLNKKIMLQDSSTVKVTNAGLLAASHLVGAGSVRKFLNSDGKIDRKDGNGVRCSDYMKQFQNNQLYLNYD